MDRTRSLSNLSAAARGPILVIGATGTVGARVVRALLARGVEVAALVRSQASASALPPGARARFGDLGDEAAVTRAVADASVVFFVSPHAADEEQYAENVVAACERTQVRLVFLGVHLDAPWAWLRALLRATFGNLVAPHYKARFRIGERVLGARTRTQILIASTFFQNDEVFRDDVLEGRYTQPLGVGAGVTQVDVRDIAEVAVKVLLDPTLPMGCVPVAGTEAINGPRAAAIWSEALGRPVVYAGEERAVWERAITRKLSGHKREDFLATFRLLAKLAFAPSASAVARTTELLGRPPRDYRAYVNDVVSAMRSGTELST